MLQLVEEQEKRKSKAQRLVELADGCELFHGPDARAYASVRHDGHLETHPIRSVGFRRYLVAKFWKTYSESIHPPAVQEAMLALESRAIYEGPEKGVGLRVAEWKDQILLDLCDADWRVVEITRNGWRVIQAAEAPIRFRRADGMLALPEPRPGGNLQMLRDMLGLSDAAHDKLWANTAAWLVQAIRPRGPFPVLGVHGKQGSSKSTLARMLRGLVDPNSAPLRSASHSAPLASPAELTEDSKEVDSKGASDAGSDASSPMELASPPASLASSLLTIVRTTVPDASNASDASGATESDSLK